ncbi:unnamed protein product, partial [marine sediment metagenome]
FFSSDFSNNNIIRILSERAYKKKDYENFDASKKLILQLQKKISEIIK